MAKSTEVPRRLRLSRDRVLWAGVTLADEIGSDALSMRKLAEELGVVPMALYKHVADKVRELESRYPHIAEMVGTVYQDDASVVGRGCDDQFEFEFALDVLLDGLERLRTHQPASARLT